jgi:hypothetical protein
MTRRLLVALALLAPAAVDAAAQSTGTPVYQAPYRAFKTYEIGGNLTDPGSGWTLEGFYRWAYKNFDLGVRTGIWDPGNNASSVFLIGLDARTRVLTHSDKFPLDGAFTLGLGGNFGDGDVGYIPIGFSLGRRILLENSQTSFIPYVHPVLTPAFGDRSDLLFTLGLGVDIKFTSSFDLRLGGGIGDLDGIGIGAAYLH